MGVYWPSMRKDVYDFMQEIYVRPSSLSSKPLHVARVSEQFLPHIVDARGVTCNLAWKHNAVSMHHHTLPQISCD